jgi:hypothetical protein
VGGVTAMRQVMALAQAFGITVALLPCRRSR